VEASFAPLGFRYVEPLQEVRPKRNSAGITLWVRLSARLASAIGSSRSEVVFDESTRQQVGTHGAVLCIAFTVIAKRLSVVRVIIVRDVTKAAFRLVGHAGAANFGFYAKFTLIDAVGTCNSVPTQIAVDRTLRRDWG